MKFPACVSSDNLICKHVRSIENFYVDLDNQIPEDVTITAATADTEDDLLEIGDVTIVDEDTIVPGEDDCDDVTLLAGRALIIGLSGGTILDDNHHDEQETIV